MYITRNVLSVHVTVTYPLIKILIYLPTDNYHLDVMDFLGEDPKVLEHSSPPNTPSPKSSNHILERNDSFNDDLFEGILLIYSFIYRYI